MLIIYVIVLHMKDFLFKTNKLDRVRPNYEVMLKISLSDSELSHPCKGKMTSSHVVLHL